MSNQPVSKVERVSRVPEKFRTSDGCEYATAEEAVVHQGIVDALDTYRSAQGRLASVLAESKLTADGKQFSFSRWTYYVVDCRHSFPRLRDVAVSYGRGDSILVDDNNEVQLIERDGKDSIHWNISSLYVDRRKATEALIAAQEDRLAQYRKHIDELKATLR